MNWWDLLLFSTLGFKVLFLSCRYDRQKVMLKEIHSCQYVACMNPMVGSFTINPRLQVEVCQYSHMVDLDFCLSALGVKIRMYGSIVHLVKHGNLF